MPSMAPTSRSHANSNARSSKPTLEIIPTSRFIVFNGSEHEASSVKLEGVVRLTTPEPTSILKPKVRLEGKRKISWFYIGGISAGEVSDKRTFWTQEQKLGNLESSHKVKAGTIEWPFEFELSPSMPESVEGLRETYIAYHLSASVSRPGWNSKDVVAQEHIRLVRTLGQDSMETTRSRVNADIWANKIAYSISIPTDAIVFGTSITADVELSPIKKGLRLGKVELRLLETVVKRIQLGEMADSRGDRSKSEETEVAKADMEFPEHSRVMYDDETIDNPTMADEMYKFKATLPLPKSLNKCRQDVDSHQINVTHRFKLMVNIHNPEGHISQLVCRLPVKIFISPNLPVDESNEVCALANGMSHEALNSAETSLVAPPEYGRHQLDQLFSDMDPTGFTSRAPSIPGSPAGLGAQSRRGSHDANMPSLNGIANDMLNTSLNGENGDSHGGASPSMLQARLADLQERGTNPVIGRSSAMAISYSPSGGNSPSPGLVADSSDPASISRNNSYYNITSSPVRQSPPSSAPISRRISNEDDDSAEVQQSDYNMASLARVPSYGFALRTSGTVTPYNQGPPTYIEATSRPPSPNPVLSQSPPQPPPLQLQRPGQAHVRAGIGAETPISNTRQNTFSSGISNLRLVAEVTGGEVQPLHHRNSSSAAADDEARMRMLRARN
jgi:arrestin-related trafficking adapter 4/5/7